MNTPNCLLTRTLTGSNTQAPQDGDIAIEYHPHSRRRTRIVNAEEFKETLNNQPDPTMPPDDEPWLPFSSRENFDFAELVHDAKLNQKQTDRLIGLINRCQTSPGSFTLCNYNDLRSSLENASKLLTNVRIYCSSLVLNPLITYLVSTTCGDL